jgi:predicted ATPase
VNYVFKHALVQEEAYQSLLRSTRQHHYQRIAQVLKVGERCWTAELYRLRGELLLRSVADERQAEACFHQALEVSRRQQARLWELRAAVSLSRLWQRQCKRDAARELLSPLYGWFTEGFETADLREAKALLAEL